MVGAMTLWLLLYTMMLRSSLDLKIIISNKYIKLSYK